MQYNLIDGVPWPRLDNMPSKDVALRDDYPMQAMDYLDHPNALPIYEAYADAIQHHSCTGIVDVGCRWGRVNDVLIDAELQYNYLGFDTSAEPIKHGQEIFDDKSYIKLLQASWQDPPKADFDVDCVILGAVLIYDESIYERLLNFYKAHTVIIQEPMQSQIHWHPELKLQRVDLEKYAPFDTDVIVEAEVFAGNRRIVSLKYPS